MPIKQLATISVPQPRTMAIQPFDKGNLGMIEKAIPGERPRHHAAGTTERISSS